MKKQKKPLRGILPALCTTFGRDGALDLEGGGMDRRVSQFEGTV